MLMKYKDLGRLLGKEEQKKIIGGTGEEGNPPSSPGGGGEGAQYKCCWDAYPNSCSICVNCAASCTCVANASLKVCPS